MMISTRTRPRQAAGLSGPPQAVHGSPARRPRVAHQQHATELQVDKEQQAAQDFHDRGQHDDLRVVRLWGTCSKDRQSQGPTPGRALAWRRSTPPSRRRRLHTEGRGAAARPIRMRPCTTEQAQLQGCPGHPGQTCTRCATRLTGVSGISMPVALLNCASAFSSLGAICETTGPPVSLSHVCTLLMPAPTKTRAMSTLRRRRGRPRQRGKCVRSRLGRAAERQCGTTVSWRVGPHLATSVSVDDAMGVRGGGACGRSGLAVGWWEGSASGDGYGRAN